MEVNAGLAILESSGKIVIEMASASGITLITNNQLNPLETTTYGTGQLIKKAATKNPGEILLAIGGSATVDMGIGAAMAMGWRFEDCKGKSIGHGGKELKRICNIIPPNELPSCKITVLSDVENPLYGPQGAAKIFAPQKGADPQQVEILEEGMIHLAELVKKQLGCDIANVPGAGAAGGLGAGAVAFLNAEIVSGIEKVINEIKINLEKAMIDADWVITGEGKFDEQSTKGKVISGILKTAKKTNTKVAVIAGQVQIPPEKYSKLGITEAFSTKKKKASLWITH